MAPPEGGEVTTTVSANKDLQRKLRAMIECDGLTEVGRQLDVGREPLLRYLSNIYLHTSTFRGIEASIAAAPFDPLPLRTPRTRPRTATASEPETDPTTGDR